MKNIRTPFSLFVVQLLPTLLVGQGQLQLRYDPVRDVAVHTAFQTVTMATSGDGRVIETADLGSVRAIALELAEGGTVIHMAYDSVKARIRSDGGTWREFNVPDADSAWVQASIDDQMQISGTRSGSRLPAVTGLLDILTGVPGLTLPEQPVRVGGAWMVESELTERMAVSVPQGIGELPPLKFSTRITLDSAVQRAQDTLGYFTVSGYVRPISEADVRDLETEGLTVSSEMTGQLVWSTGWHGFVSGANRVKMEIVKSRSSINPTIERVEPELVVRITTRFQIRP
ncbi:hypothetical protein ACFL3B_05645 [Gemmatimonadota bacterium]